MGAIQSTYSRTQLTPTQCTRPLVCRTFSRVRLPPSLYTMCVIPALLEDASALHGLLGFQSQVFLQRAPIWVSSSMKIPLASAPSVVWTSTNTTAPRRRLGLRSSRVPGVYTDEESLLLFGVVGGSAETLRDELDALLLFEGDKSGLIPLLETPPVDRGGGTRDALKHRFFFEGLGVDSSAGFKGILVVV